ncbi:MAG: sulfatase [Acidobacteriota bacterium]
MALPILCLSSVGCSPPDRGEGDGPPQPTLAPTRGYILISADTLRADRLGSYGHWRDTSPHLDALAAEGVVFERAFASAPSTLISHMSMFTGLHPGQHGVDGPRNNVLPAEVTTLPEIFQHAGYRTSGHTEGGYMNGAHGFARGFDVFTDSPWQSVTDVEATFRHGTDFLRDLGPDDPFFLFLHTYTIHDPYEPPEEERASFADDGEDLDFRPSGHALAEVNQGRRVLTEGQGKRLGALYDAGIYYFDGVLGRFLDELEDLGLRDEVTLVLTSDHGEEFLEHGRLLHTQVYPEGLHVPLLVLHPDAAPRRIEAPVRIIDIAPTLWGLAGLDGVETTGRSLVTYLAGGELEETDAYGEVNFDSSQKTLVGRYDGVLYQLVSRRPLTDPDGGTWVGESLDFEASSERLEFRALAYHEPRTIELRFGDQLLRTVEVAPDRWSSVTVELPPDPRPLALRLSSPSCVSPKEVGAGEDIRCLAFKVAGLPLAELELYDLDADPGAEVNLAQERPDVLRRLARRLSSQRHEPVAQPGRRELSEEEVKALEALGYL